MTTDWLNDENRTVAVRSNILKIKDKIKIAALNCGRRFEEVNLMAVVKNVCDEDVKIAIKEGINLFGESRLKSLNLRSELYSCSNVEVHFIGNLQTNKVRDVVSKVDLIESISSVRLAEIVGKNAMLIKKTMPVFLEVNVGNEESKFGFLPSEILEAARRISKIDGIKIKGFMAIPPKENVSYFFKKMREIYIDISSKKIDNVNIRFLSMGMSEDFEKAIGFGSNLVRVGKKMFE